MTLIGSLFLPASQCIPLPLRGAMRDTLGMPTTPAPFPSPSQAAKQIQAARDLFDLSQKVKNNLSENDINWLYVISRSNPSEIVKSNRVSRNATFLAEIVLKF